jgi:hypothetical protein
MYRQSGVLAQFSTLSLFLTMIMKRIDSKFIPDTKPKSEISKHTNNFFQTLLKVKFDSLKTKIL